MDKKNMKILVLILCISMITALAVGCSSKSTSTSNNSDEKKTIVIGTSSVSKDLAESGVKPLEKMGYKVEIKVFNDYVLPDSAVIDGSIDANFYQHEPYMKNFNDTHNSHIMMLQPKLYNYYTGIYSIKANSLEDLPNGGAVGIPEDAANLSVQLQQLQQAGLITLSSKPSSGKFYNLADIASNPHNFKFVSGDGNKYKNMSDYALVVGTSNTMATAGVDPTKHLLKKFVDNNLALGISILPKNKDAKWVKDMMTAYTSKEAIDSVPASSGFDYYGK